MEKVIKFPSTPTFAQLWDTCANQHIYDIERYSEELISLMKRNRITRKSSIADVAAGGGFPAIHLRKLGFHIDCYDAMSDQVKMFKENAIKEGVDPSITQCEWLSLPTSQTTKYDFILCRGNSFIYAPGGWNSDKFNKRYALMQYRKTLKVFYNVLAPQGIVYLDKFPDEEKDHKEVAAKVNISGKKYDLLFYTKLDWKQKERFASMLLRDEKGKESGTPNRTYALSERELRNCAKEEGFSQIEKLNLKSEPLFDIYLLRK